MNLVDLVNISTPSTCKWTLCEQYEYPGRVEMFTKFTTFTKYVLEYCCLTVKTSTSW